MTNLYINKENGNTYYFKHKNMTILHREDGPAIETSNGDKYWYFNNQLHREDGPATEQSNGNKYWYLHGKRHREDGPAIEYPNGDKLWYLYGDLHREDGPAYETVSGPKEYWFEGKEYSNIPSNEYWIKLCKMKKFL